ncbi:MAG TPA: hypothetical protein PLP21_03205 [Pyrinomonadaceae bacterium]|nr:hypothetical protein [Acidobacteriota bacterium]HQZ95296.1 hypothetical protein [Pyrinomonadaceae bacterium]
MKMIQFSMYYVKLQFTVAFGLYRTSLPMDVNWRWRFWQQRNNAQHRPNY